MLTLEDVLKVGGALERFPVPWFVCGGWGLDLWLGRATREHEDLEIGIFRQHQGWIARTFEGAALEKNVHGAAGKFWAAWNGREILEPPVFQTKVRRRGRATFEFFLHDVANDSWTYRRNPGVTRPARELIVRSMVHQLPVCAPEVTLLFKAKYPTGKNAQDFEAVWPLLSAGQRGWLVDALRVAHPGHAWAERPGGA